MNLTDDSRGLAAVQFEAHVNVWLSSLGDPNNSTRQITSGVGQYNGVRGLTWTPDQRLVYVSRISGSQDIWIMQEDGQNGRQLTTPETRADIYPLFHLTERVLFLSQLETDRLTFIASTPTVEVWRN
jgi:Tol biopolymer transport system component